MNTNHLGSNPTKFYELNSGYRHTSYSASLTAWSTIKWVLDRVVAISIVFFVSIWSKSLSLFTRVQQTKNIEDNLSGYCSKCNHSILLSHIIRSKTQRRDPWGRLWLHFCPMSTLAPCAYSTINGPVLWWQCQGRHIGKTQAIFWLLLASATYKSFTRPNGLS